MRVLVTGAGGFIGSWVIDQLLAARHQVIAVDRGPASFRRIVHWGDQISMASLDLAERAPVRSLLAATAPDAIVHLAWYANPADYLTSHENLASLTMTNRFMEAALAQGCRKFVMAGTCVEYGVQDRMLGETDPIIPRSVYAACKHAAWLVASALASTTGAEVSWARIFHIHGPGEDEKRVVPWIAGELRAGRAVELTDGKQVRDHLHVSDMAAGLVALLAPGASGIYNVCSGRPVTLRQVIETVGEIVGRSDLLRFGARPHRAEETMFLVGDPSRLRALGWSPRFGLREGLADALAPVAPASIEPA